MNIVFPASGGIAGLVYWVIANILNWGWVGYGLAVVFLTVFIKLIMAPLDFCNRYVSRKNQVQTQALSSEIKDLEKIYGNDPLAFTRARQELLRKNGVGGGGSALIVLVSLIVTMVVFFNVMGALNSISKLNIAHQYQELSAVYDEYQDSAELGARLDQTYRANQTSFFWIKNIWQADTPWTKAVMTLEQYNKAVNKEDRIEVNEANQARYNAIYQNLNPQYRGNNGWLILVVLAGLTSFLSTKLTTLLNQKNAPKTKTEKSEPVITYSLRDAKAQSANDLPTIDPAQMTNILQIVMPVTFMLFALNQTAAFAIYMIASSVIGTVLNLGFAVIIESLLKHRKPTDKNQDFDATVINPHAKYFKGGKK